MMRNKSKQGHLGERQRTNEYDFERNTTDSSSSSIMIIAIVNWQLYN